MDAPEIFRNLLKMMVRSKKRGFQSELAQKCGVDPKHLSDFLGGRSVLSESKRIAIVEELGFEYDEFLAMGKGHPKTDSEGNLKPAKSTQFKPRIHSRACDRDRPPGDMLSNFNNRNKARVCVDKLLEIDGLDPERLDAVEIFLCGYLEGLKPQKKTASQI